MQPNSSCLRNSINSFHGGRKKFKENRGAGHLETEKASFSKANARLFDTLHIVGAALYHISYISHISKIFIHSDVYLYPIH